MIVELNGGDLRGKFHCKNLEAILETTPLFSG